MKLLCEDLKSILVQITKGNLYNGKLSYADLNAKMDKKINTLKGQYANAGIIMEGGEQVPSLTDASFVSVIHIFFYVRVRN